MLPYSVRRVDLDDDFFGQQHQYTISTATPTIYMCVVEER